VLPTSAPTRIGPPTGPSGPAVFHVPGDLVGEWSGTLRTYQRTIPMRLEINPDGNIRAWIGDQRGAVVTNANFADGRLSGTFAGRIPTDDAERWPHDVSFGLLLRGGRLAGEVTANSTADRVYYTLSSYAELTKK
jgi:hypothetical protein